MITVHLQAYSNNNNEEVRLVVALLRIIRSQLGSVCFAGRTSFSPVVDFVA